MPVVLQCAGQLRRGNVSPAVNGNAYWENLIAKPEHLASASLRSQANIDSLCSSPPNTWITYDGSKDAAKLTWNHTISSLPNNQQLEVLLGASGTGGTSKLLYIWDMWLDPNWRTVADGGQVNTLSAYAHKEYQFMLGRAGGSPAYDGKIYLETFNEFRDSNPSSAACRQSTRRYGSDDVEGDGASAQTNTPIFAGSSDAGYVNIPHGEWVRRINEVRLNQPDTAFPEWESLEADLSSTRLYHMLSAWVIDRAGNIYRRHWKKPISRYKNSDGSSELDPYDKAMKWQVEHNTSSDGIDATGTVTFTGVNGTAIATNKTFTRNSDGAVYKVSSGGTISGGSVTLACVSNLGGEDKNCPPGTAFTISQANVDPACSAATSFTGGLYNMNVDCFIWTRNFVCLKDYALHASSPETNNPEIFAAPIA